MTDTPMLLLRLDAYRLMAAEQATYERRQGRIAEATMLDTCAALHEQAAKTIRQLKEIK